MITLWLLMRLSFYTADSLVPQDGQFICANGSVASDRSLGLELELFRHLKNTPVEIPALARIGHPGLYYVQDTGSFRDPRAIDVYLPGAHNPDAYAVLDRLRKACTAPECQPCTYNGRRYICVAAQFTITPEVLSDAYPRFDGWAGSGLDPADLP